MNFLRPRAEDFLELVQRSRRGRLKLYIGFAAGVGKTYRMLEEAHALKSRGIDVVLGLVETHGRPETAALIEGLAYLPRRQIVYRGVGMEDMDVDALLKRAPQVTVVDEIAHTNAPVLRNRKRYQDVLDLLDAGINVIGAFNIQHLESLNDIIAKVTHVRVRETVPDSFLKQADQIVNLDLTVEDLLERLKSGKIYTPEKVAWALENFFQESSLSALRELALREVAESLERTGSVRERRFEGRPMGEGRVMVCITSHPPHASILLRRGSRLAGKLNTDWYVVYVETPREATHLIDAEAQRHLLSNLSMAKDLGADVVRLKDRDPVKALIAFARSHGVGYLVMGRSHQPMWKQWLWRSVPFRILMAVDDMDVHVVAFDTGPKGSSTGSSRGGGSSRGSSKGYQDMAYPNRELVRSLE